MEPDCDGSRRGTQLYCNSYMQDASPLTGMVPMDLLMSAFHLAPWLRLFSSRPNGARST